MTNEETEAYKKKKETYVLIKIKPKYVEQFCIMMVACKEVCNRAPKSKNLAKIDEVFSVLGPFDFLLELSGEGKDEKKIDEKINKTIFRILKTLGNYIYETCTLTKFELSSCLEENDNFKKLIKNAKLLETERREYGELNVFRDFLTKEGVFDKLEDFQKELKKEELDFDETKIKNLWKKNKCLFGLEDNCKKYLKNGNIDVNVNMKKEINAKIQKKLSDKAELFNIDNQNWKIVDDMKRYGIYDAGIGKELKVHKIITKDVHVLIRVKPLYTLKFFVAMSVFKSLCNRDTSSQNLAIIDEVFSVLGPFDFLLELSVVGENVEKKDEKINRTILKIRETLGGYINETLTIKKFKIPMTKEELEKLFEKNLGYKHLAKLPGRNGEKIPDESFNDKCDLIDICDAETTSLEHLLIHAKTSEIDELNEQIVNLKNRVKKLEKFIQS